MRSIQTDIKIPRDAFVDGSAVIGKNVIIEHGARIYERCKVGDNSVIGPNAILRPGTIIGEHTIFGTLSEADGDCQIGSYVTVQVGCLVAYGMSIGDNCFIGPHTTIINTKEITPGRHGRKPGSRPEILKTVIENDVRVGARCLIAPGVRIGHDALIDMGTMVTRDVPPFAHLRGGRDQVGRIMP